MQSLISKTFYFYCINQQIPLLLNVKGLNKGGMVKNVKCDDLDVILQNIPGALFLHNMDGDIVLVNDRTEEYTGYSKNELLKMNVSEIDPDSITRHDRQQIWESLQNRKVKYLKTRHKRKDGSTYNAEISITSIVYHEENVLLAVVHDTTERTNLEKELRDSEEKYRVLFENATLGIFTSTPEGRFLNVNTALANMLGYETPDEVIKNITNIAEQIYVKGEKRKDIVDKQKSTNTTQHYVNHYRKKNGEVWIANLYLRSLKSPQNGEIYYEGIVEDITEKEQDSQRIKKLLEEKEILLHEVHHRIKNNMNTMQSLLKLNASSVDEVKCKATLLDAASRINSMQILYDKLYRTDNYQNISTTEYLANLANDIKSNFPQRDNVKIESHIDDIAFSNTQIFYFGLIVNELITNSMKYAFKSNKQGRIFITILKNENIVTFIYKDTGCGYPADFTPTQNNSFGISLINMLANYFKGEYFIGNKEGGAEFNLTFEL